MQILRARRGFQADHSSSSYLFYAADKPVSEQGRRIAHRYSSRADVGKRSVRYEKWGESSLSFDAYKALMADHYDVMVSESYDWWTMIIAVPKNAKTKMLGRQFADARGGDDLGVDVEQYGSRWAVSIYCVLDHGSIALDHDDPFGYLVRQLVKVRKEITDGDFSFLIAVADFYGDSAGESEDRESDDDSPRRPDETLTKQQLQEECKRLDLPFRKSWTKTQLREALQRRVGGTSLSSAARELLGCLDRI
ncbi:MAG: hypothetical protein L0228_20675 [Planctomycetes bacterium]|nr:hypothetical protein [Planctomycetota bacterium]